MHVKEAGSNSSWCAVIVPLRILACIIFAGATFSRVHESRMMYDCLSLGTLVSLLAFILSTSLAHISIMVCHPKYCPSLKKLFEPPILELCRADTIFLSCSSKYKYILFSYTIVYACMHIQCIYYQECTLDNIYMDLTHRQHNC